MRPVVFLLLLSLFSCSPEKPVATTINTSLDPMPAFQRQYWPTDGWREKLLPADRWHALEDYAFSRTGDEEDRAGIRTDGVVIIRNGYLIYERYAAGYDQNMPHLTWSISKSVIQALIGIAQKEGLLSIEDPIEKYIAEARRDRPIRIKHLLQMSSGLDANEGYESGPLKSSVIAMLYTRGRNDMARFCASLPSRAEPGKYVYYSSCDTNILSGALKNALIQAHGEQEGRKQYSQYPWEKLFGPLGMKTAVWERDASGTFVGSSYLYASPRDMAKFAFLYLNNGQWEGNQLLPENWLDLTRTVAPAYESTPAYPGWEYLYTAHWYANTGIPELGLKPQWPSAPEDTFAATGHWGQMIFIIPGMDMIIVRMGDDRDGSFDKDRFLKLILEAVEK